MYNPKYFALSEFNCQETNENDMQEEFLKKLDLLREACGFPFVITSGYRGENHSNERNKPNGGGTHTKGIAADIKAVSGTERYAIVQHALALGRTISRLQEWEWLSLSFMLIYALQSL